MYSEHKKCQIVIILILSKVYNWSMNDPHQEFDGDEALHKEQVHEENRENKEHAKAHENQNPNLGKGHNPTPHNIGGK